MRRTDAEKQRLIPEVGRLRQKGLTFAEIAAQLGVGPEAASHYAYLAGAPQALPGRKASLRVLGTPLRLRARTKVLRAQVDRAVHRDWMAEGWAQCEAKDCPNLFRKQGTQRFCRNRDCQAARSLGHLVRDDPVARFKMRRLELERLKAEQEAEMKRPFAAWREHGPSKREVAGVSLESPVGSSEMVLSQLVSDPSWEGAQDDLRVMMESNGQEAA